MSDIFNTLKKHHIWVVLVLFILISVILNYVTTKNIHSLPSPLYGGDYYFQLGSVNHVAQGGNPFQSSSSNGEIAIYHPLYSILAGYTSMLLGVDAMTAMIILSYIFVIIALLIIYYLSYSLFESEILGLFTALICMTAYIFPIYKYTNFGSLIMVPLFLLMLYNFLFKSSIKNSIFLGIVYGLLGLTHSIIFIFASILLILVMAYYWLYSDWKQHKRLFYSKINFLNYALVFGIGILIAMLWWFIPIFVFHGKANMFINNIYDFKFQLTILSLLLKNTFLGFSTLKGVILSVLMFVGVVGISFSRKHGPKTRFVIFLFISYIIIVLHYFITQNIFGIQMAPDYMMGIYWIIPVLFATYGIKILLSFIKWKTVIYGLYILVIVLSLFTIYLSYSNYIKSDVWFANSKASFPEQYSSLHKYFESNGGSVNDVIVTTKEVGFAVNSITGRKLVSIRRGHAGQFQLIPSDKRELDTAIILYGNNTAKKLELINYYDVKYLYWDYYWIQSEYTIDAQGKVGNSFDPLIMLYSDNAAITLMENGVKYVVTDGWLDPSIRGENVAIQKVIIISPDNYVSFNHPWKNDLDQYLEKVWVYNSGGQEIATLYKIRVP